MNEQTYETVIRVLSERLELTEWQYKRELEDSAKLREENAELKKVNAELRGINSRLEDDKNVLIDKLANKAARG